MVWPRTAPAEFILRCEYKCFQKLMYVRRLTKFSTYTLIQFRTMYWYKIFLRILDRLPDINFLDHASISFGYFRGLDFCRSGLRQEG